MSMIQWLSILIGPAVLILLLVAVYRARKRQDSWLARIALIGLAVLLVLTVADYLLYLLSGGQ
jgi:chromate transport protein ChrA